MEIYFETEKECDEFRKQQKCFTRKYYDKTTQSYYLILFSKHDWLNREIKPNLKILHSYQELYNKYCHIVKDIESCLKYGELSQLEKEELPKLLIKFNKFRDDTRQCY